MLFFYAVSKHWPSAVCLLRKKEMEARRNTKSHHSDITWQHLIITSPDGAIQNCRRSMPYL